MGNEDPIAGGGAGPGRAARGGLAFAALLTLVLVYLPARNMPFFYDDRVTIVQNEKIQSRRLSDVLLENPFRALPNLTFALQLRLHAGKTLPPGVYDLAATAHYIERRFSKEQGRYLAFYNDPQTMESIPVSIDAARGVFFPLPDAAPFHRFNMLLHFLNAALLYLVLKRLFPGRGPLAAAAAAAFLIHPLATEPVNYVTARFGLMAVSFSLAAVLFHLRADQRPRADLAALAAFIMALLCKETAAVLPLIAFILDAARGRPRLRVLTMLAVSAAYGLLRIMVWPVVPEGSGGPALSVWRYVLVEQRVIIFYLIHVLVPIHLNFDPDVIPRMVPDLITAVASAALLTGSAAVIIKSAAARLQSKNAPPPQAAQELKARSRSGKESARPMPPPAAPVSPWAWPAAAVLSAWIAMAPVSTLIPLSDLAKEERAYPLLIIVLPALILGIASLIAAPRAGLRRTAAGCLAAAILCFAALTIARNRQWQNELTLTRDMVQGSPQKSRAAYQYGTALKWAGDFNQALFWYEQAVRLDPSNADALVNIKVLRQQLGEEKPRTD